MSEQPKPRKIILDLKRETEIALKRNQKSAVLYDLEPSETFKDITQELFDHPNTTDLVKTAIQHHHKYYVFSYPSDGVMIKGYLSLPENTQDPIPLIILLRGGNRLFGLPHPGELTTQKGYAVVATTYRGGVSEGEDEFGGDDINDVKNLMDFLPALEEKLNVHFHPTNKYMIGVSRGGMQLFLTLARYPELQTNIKKVASISGLLNIKHALEGRSDLKEILIEHCGFTEDEKGKEWIAKRQTINYVSQISKNLPILIAQGTDDRRVSLQEGYDMLTALKDSDHEVTYIEIEGGDHILMNTPSFIPTLIDWLEKP